VPIAVGAGVAAADHDDVLALSGDGALGSRPLLAVAGVALILLGQEIHRKMDTAELAPWNLEVARRLGPAGHRHGVELLEQRGHRHVDPDLDLGAELHPLGLHLHDAAVNQRFVHLEVGDAVAQQSADAVALLEQGHGVTGARQLLRAGEARRPRADDRDPLAGLLWR